MNLEVLIACYERITVDSPLHDDLAEKIQHSGLSGTKNFVPDEDI